MKSLQEFMAEENENFGGYRINGQAVSREEYAALYNSLEEEDYDQRIAESLAKGITRQGGNY